MTSVDEIRGCCLGLADEMADLPLDEPLYAPESVDLAKVAGDMIVK